MKRSILLLSLLLLSIISGYLLSKASLVGRTGINLFYKEYKFLKTWWKGAFAVSTAWLLIFLLHSYIQKKWSQKKAMTAHLLSIAVAAIGFYLTYYDFRHTLSHRLLGERFHLGAYLFWLGWIIIAVSNVVTNKRHTAPGTALNQPTDVASLP